MVALAPLSLLLGNQKNLEVEFDLIIDEEHVQLRQYYSYHVAKIKVESNEDDQNRESAQMRLLSYVLGKNSRSEKLEPMLPLIQEDVGARMSALMLLELHEVDPKLTAFEVSMILPEEYNCKTAPLPLDPEIKIQRVNPHMTAAVKFTGLCGKGKQARLTKYLRLWLHDKGYKVASAPRLAKFSHSFTLPFFRRNELHVDATKR